MALHVTVNGKFGKAIGRLDDPERVRKDLEGQRRITRLQQVREKSNHMAKKIREEVAAEKKRQIDKLQDVKERELNAWREHVLVKKHQDYRSAIFQVGAAHRAAKEENERNEALKQEKIDKIKTARKQAMKRSGKAVSKVRAKPGMSLNMEGRATAGTQTPTMPGEDKENRNSGGCHKPCCQGSKAKRKEAPNCECARPEEDSLSEDDSSILLSDCPALQRTPPVILDVEIDDNMDTQSLNRREGLEINDRFIQTNRKFSHVVRPSPECSPERSENPRKPRFTQITDLVRRSETVTSIRLEPVRHTDVILEPALARSAPASPTKSLPRSPRKTTERIEPPPTSKPPQGSPKKTASGVRQQQPVKRSGLKTNPAPAKVIDAGIRRNPKAKTQPPAQATAAIPLRPGLAPEQPRSLEPIPQQPQQPSLQLHMQCQPQPNPPMPLQYPPPQPYMNGYPQPYAMPYSMPFPMQAPFPPSHPIYAQQPVATTYMPAATAPPSMATAASSVTTSTFVRSDETKSIQNARVQFYDHSNKYHRTYDAPTQSVQSNEKDPGQLNAMDHARIENQLRELREHELDKLRKITNERGQKALEREQVRRDCAELTEKLDALSLQQPQLLPNDANIIPSHRFSDAAARREQKMNEAMEQMLLRPAVITCPEVSNKSSTLTSARRKCNGNLGSINVGEPPAHSDRLYMGSSESCCSILLDYVDDQSKQLRSDLKAEQTDSLKSARLRNLLGKIEKIRGQLLEELKAGELGGPKGGQAQEMINTIRQERANILSERTKTLNERESDLQQKEAILEQRLRKFYKETKSKKVNEEDDAKTKEDKPLEIIIKVKSDGTVKQYVPRNKTKTKMKEVPIEKEVSSGSTPREEKKQPEKVIETGKRPAPQDLRQFSIDSNSTAYRSLPPVNYKGLDPNASSAASGPPAPAPLHPMVAQYIQCMLGMTRQSIDELCVSSSDVATPATSIVNSSRNMTPCVDADPEDDDTLVDEQRMERVQTFIADNRSFVNDLEDSLRCQQQQQREQRDQDKEDSMRAIEQIWNQRLAKNQEDCQPRSKQREKKSVTSQGDQKAGNAQEGRISQGERNSQGERERVSQSEKARKQQTEQTNQREREPKTKQPQLSATKPTTALGPKSSSRFVAEQTKPQCSSEESSVKQMERYAQLTENCTQRIAELTDLITKVREEKQRLVNVTLTSNSDQERQSTEYFDLPNGQHTRCRTISDRSDSQTPSTSEALPLQKHKPMAASRDSGIADSRPITAMGQVVGVDIEPISLASSTQSQTQQRQHRAKAPPATIRRYSPQLDAEDLAHELSTIAEVETPGQSHIVAATPVPQPFPSFEQYAKEAKLDLSKFDADQSRRMESEFNELVKVINQRTGGLDYREFPSINAYLHNKTSTHIHMEIGGDPNQDQATFAPGELLRQLRLLNVSLQEFPNRKEYLKKLLSNQPADQRQLIDSASLESSDSLNVEEELRQRRILRTSFRRGEVTETTLTRQEVASSTRRESMPPIGPNDPPNESGIDPLSGSNFSSDAEQKRQCWHATIQSRQQRQTEADGICSSSTNTSPERQPRQSRLRGGNTTHNESKPQDVSQIGRTLNLREFLTRELLKHRAHTGESSLESSDDSLKGHFLKSVISSLSPAVGLSHATGVTNDRQKTSTPVGSFSVLDKSRSLQSADIQLFSGESHISLVHYPDGTPPIPYEKGKLGASETRQSSRQIVSGTKSHGRSPRK
ncbi:hypothetical protein KR009_007658 [Drosophila setifemur]|nr:hypothetical protein KR009_007658 [Drosophila setifemur]